MINKDDLKSICLILRISITYYCYIYLFRILFCICLHSILLEIFAKSFQPYLTTTMIRIKVANLMEKGFIRSSSNLDSISCICF